VVVGAYANRKEGEVSKQTIDIICRALLAIVAALRKEYDLPEYHNVTIQLTEKDTLTDTPLYKT
jgi:hypothetical protein